MENLRIASNFGRNILSLSLFGFLLASCATPPLIVEPPPAPPPVVIQPPPAPPPIPKIGLALGGGAARGFAHIGVIKVLEAQGIVPDMVVGTSAGSVVGVLYASGYSGFDLQKIAFELEESSVSDYTMLSRGFIKGEQLQNFINKALKHRPIEGLPKSFGAVAADLQTGESIVFRRGNAGMAVRASSSVPGVFQPVSVNNHEYVDGGLVSPVPVTATRNLGADIVIAVDISKKPSGAKIEGTFDILMQTFTIMGKSISGLETVSADVVIQPNTDMISAADFESKHLAILEGEKAAQAAIPQIRAQIQAWTDRQMEKRKITP